MLEGVQGDDPIESKVIELNNPDRASRYPVLITVFEENGNEPLQNAGWRGRYVIFNLIDSYVEDGFSDPYKAESHTMTGGLKEILLDIKNGWQSHGQEGIDWTNLEHGGSYTFSELQGTDKHNGTK